MNAEPTGIVHGIPDAEYHSLPGLSATGMKSILRSPLHYRQGMDHRVEKPVFDVGHAVHAKVLGIGMDVVELDFDSWRTKAAQEARDVARAEGKTPLLAKDLAPINAMAEAVLSHPKASPLLAMPGSPEVSLFGTDPETGVHLRGRIDYLAHDAAAVWNVDLKSTTDVRRHKLARVIADYGYDVQSEAYRHLLRINGLDPQPTVLIFVEKDPPHEVRVVSLANDFWITGGQRLMRRAIDTYSECLANDTWPGDDDSPGEAEPIDPPGYYLYETDDDVELTL